MSRAPEGAVAESDAYPGAPHPRFAPKLNIEVDYIDIALKDAIQALTLVNNLDACYDSTDFPSSPACASYKTTSPHGRPCQSLLRQL